MPKLPEKILATLPLQKKDAELDSLRDITDDVTEADFIPYAFHHNANTLITKNGELMQVFRITANADGIDFESPEHNSSSVRDAVRDAVEASITSNDYSLWVHTVRRRKPISFTPEYDESFARKMHEHWQGIMRWNYRYANEIYVTIIHQGDSSRLFDFKEISKTVMFSKNRKLREERLQKHLEELDSVSERFQEVLQKHTDCKLLTMVERKTDGKSLYYSEPLEFLYYLINLSSGEVPVRHLDISRQLSDCELTFGYDAMESRSPEGKRRFGAILTLKGSPNLSPEVMDKCLQLPEEIIISQSYHYLPSKEAVEKNLKTLNVLKSSQDPLIAHISGLSSIMDQAESETTRFGTQHTSILIIRDKYTNLDTAIGNVQDRFAELGLITIREDMMLEDCFWAILPANFPFLRRKQPLHVSRIAGLVRLNHFPSGLREDSQLGKPVVFMPTTMGTPYSFNFHVGANGHTAVFDYNSFADEKGPALVNFLITSAMHFKSRVIVLDRNQTARPLTEALDGYYKNLTISSESNTHINPFTLEDTPRNHAFLASLLSYLVSDSLKEDEETRNFLRGIVEKTYAEPPAQRQLSTALKLIRAENPSLLARDKQLLQQIFSADSDSLHFSSSFTAFNMDDAVRTGMAEPVFSYLLHRIIMQLDGRPTIIVLHEAWDLLDNDFFLPRINSLLQMLTDKNAMVIFTTRQLEEYTDSHLTPLIIDNTPTKIFIPDDISTNYFPELTGLSRYQVNALTRLERQKGEILLKHANETLELYFPLNRMETFRNVLAGDQEALRLMQIQQRQS